MARGRVSITAGLLLWLWSALELADVHYVSDDGGGGAPLHTPISPPNPEHNVGQVKAAKAYHYSKLDVPSSGPLHLAVREDDGALIEELDLD